MLLQPRAFLFIIYISILSFCNGTCDLLTGQRKRDILKSILRYPLGLLKRVAIEFLGKRTGMVKLD